MMKSLTYGSLLVALVSLNGCADTATEAHVFLSKSMSNAGNNLEYVKGKAQVAGKHLNRGLNDTKDTLVDLGYKFNMERLRDLENIKTVLNNAEDRLNSYAKEKGEAIADKFHATKDSLTKRATGFNRDSQSDIDDRQDARLSELEDEIDASVKTLGDAIAKLDRDLGGDIDSILAELIIIKTDIEDLQDNDRKTFNKLRKLKKKIRKVARNDDYCSVVESVSYHDYRHNNYHWTKTITTLECPDSSFKLDTDLVYGHVNP